jgi:hypothetical protein
MTSNLVILNERRDFEGKKTGGVFFRHQSSLYWLSFGALVVDRLHASALSGPLRLVGTGDVSARR